jgi:hypothetical protein
MALGLKYGKASNDPDQKKMHTYAKTLEFFDEFKKLHGTINCKELLRGLDWSKPEDQKKISELKLHDTLCNKYVVDAVEIAERIMSKE